MVKGEGIKAIASQWLGNVFRHSFKVTLFGSHAERFLRVAKWVLLHSLVHFTLEFISH
jgi:hypothetical protein